MAIDKSALFESTKALWPSTIDVSANPDATNQVYWGHEKAFSADDDWRQLALWSFHQALGALERRTVAKGFSRVSPHEVTFAEFDRWMRSNLNGADCWSEKRAEYDRNV